jgi:hypothetical protein
LARVRVPATVTGETRYGSAKPDCFQIVAEIFVLLFRPTHTLPKCSQYVSSAFQSSKFFAQIEVFGREHGVQRATKQITTSVYKLAGRPDWFLS